MIAKIKAIPTRISVDQVPESKLEFTAAQGRAILVNRCLSPFINHTGTCTATSVGK